MMRLVVGLVGIGGVVLSGLAAGPRGQEVPPAVQILHLQRPVVIGHRGFSKAAPENTLPAFRLALLAGADLVELDTYPSRDGVWVVFHDTTLDRTTDAVRRWGQKKVRVTSKTVAELKQLDAGGWFAPRYAGTRIPLLTEALDAIHQGGGVTLIERKEGDPEALARILEKKHLVNRVVVQAFDWEFLRRFHQRLPEQVLGALGPPSRHPDGRKVSREERVLCGRWLDQLASTGAQIVVWNARDVEPKGVAEAHRRGLKVWVWTVDDPKEAGRLLGMGVDGMISNNPAQMWKVIALRAWLWCKKEKLNP